MEKEKQFRKSFIWNMLGSGINAFNSLFFMIVVTRINGVIDAGIFTLAFSTVSIALSVNVFEISAGYILLNVSSLSVSL